VDYNAWQVWAAEPWQTIQFPPVYLTEDEEAIVKPIMNDVNTLVDENVNGFITGAKNLTGDYDDMVAMIKSRGIDEATKVYQAAFDRYLEALKGA
jgi:putative aldouronate transport system substrate-binding protein